MVNYNELLKHSESNEEETSENQTTICGEKLANILLNNSEKFVISSNILYKLSDFVENCLNYLGIRFEIVAENNMMSFVNRMTGKVFIKSDLDNFREYDLRGIQGNNSKLKKLIDWEPKLNLNQISQKMIDYELKISNK